MARLVRLLVVAIAKKKGLNCIHYRDLYIIKPLEGSLTYDTFYSLSHTLRVMSSMCKYLLDEINFDFVLLGKIASNWDVEQKDSKYRELYKLIENCVNRDDNANDVLVYQQQIYKIYDDSHKSIIVGYSAEYISRKLIIFNKINPCCKSIFVNDGEICKNDELVKLLDRGGLTYATNLVKSIARFYCAFFQRLMMYQKKNADVRSLIVYNNGYSSSFIKITKEIANTVVPQENFSLIQIL
eukprot:Pgem_evm1s19518